MKHEVSHHHRAGHHAERIAERSKYDEDEGTENKASQRNTGKERMKRGKLHRTNVKASEGYSRKNLTTIECDSEPSHGPSFGSQIDA